MHVGLHLQDYRNGNKNNIFIIDRILTEYKWNSIIMKVSVN